MNEDEVAKILTVLAKEGGVVESDFTLETTLFELILHLCVGCGKMTTRKCVERAAAQESLKFRLLIFTVGIMYFILSRFALN